MGSLETAEALCASGVAETAPEAPSVRARARARERSRMDSSFYNEDILRLIPCCSKLQRGNLHELQMNNAVILDHTAAMDGLNR